MDNVSLIADLDPKATNLEGYLFPDTYEFSPETTPAELVEMMVKRFRDVWQPDATERARSLNMTPREIVTTASIIETEAKLDEERPLVASVIYNRLQKNIPLAVDSSVIYASKLEGKWRYDGKVYRSDIERRSPYNTRIYAGLPPGPVASPGESSLKAALNPATSDYFITCAIRTETTARTTSITTAATSKQASRLCAIGNASAMRKKNAKDARAQANPDKAHIKRTPKLKLVKE